MQTQTPRLSVENLEHRLLAGTYVGLNLSKLEPDAGLPSFTGVVSELSLVNGLTGGAPSRISLVIDAGATGRPAVVTATAADAAAEGATTTVVAAAGPLAANGVQNQAPSDLFQVLDAHPLFQKNGGSLTGDLGALPSPGASNAPHTVPPAGGTGASAIPANPTSSEGGSAAAPAPAPEAPTAPPLTPPAANAPFEQATLEAVASGNTGNGGNNGNTSNNGADAFGLTVPVAHARVFWTPEKIAQARAWYYDNGFEFTARADDIWGNAFQYVLTQNQANADVVINALMNFQISESELAGVASDNYRWADWVPVTYDWVYDAMTPDQRQTIMDRYNYYAETMMNKSWGGPSMPTSNYFWGYFRNEFNWAVATYYENPMAQTFLYDALVTRWQNSFLPYANSGGLGGVAAEGTQYGAYMLNYPIIPLVTADNLGRNLLDETNFYKEALVNLVYTTSPAPTYRKAMSDPYYQVFPFGDDETFGGYPSAQSQYLGDFMTVLATHWSDRPIGQYARAWLNLVNPDTSWHVASMDTDWYAPSLPLENLPTDYYAPGSGYLYSRNQWGPDATNIFFQLGQATGTSHMHLDTGSFQIWRNGYYLSKTSTGYETPFSGGTSQDTIATNGILFGGMGQTWRRDSDPEVLRLQSTNLFSYAAVDLSGTYTGGAGNPYAQHVIREFIYIKPLETLFILDRLESSGDAMPAAQVDKTFLLHFPEEPYQDSPNSVIGFNGDQALRLTSLGQRPTFNVVDESDFDGHHETDPAYYNYRLEATISGQAQSYFLNVLQARGWDEANVTSHMTQDANSWTITLDHPTKGHAKIVLNKGMTSFGGSVGYSRTQTPTNLRPLLDHVQDIQVTDDGPVWGR